MTQDAAGSATARVVHSGMVPKEVVPRNPPIAETGPAVDPLRSEAVECHPLDAHVGWGTDSDPVPTKDHGDPSVTDRLLREVLLGATSG